MHQEPSDPELPTISLEGAPSGGRNTASAALVLTSRQAGFDRTQLSERLLRWRYLIGSGGPALIARSPCLEPAALKSIPLIRCSPPDVGGRILHARPHRSCPVTGQEVSRGYSR